MLLFFLFIFLFFSPTAPTFAQTGPTSIPVSCNKSHPSQFTCYGQWYIAYHTGGNQIDGDFSGDGKTSLTDYEMWRRLFVDANTPTVTPAGPTPTTPPSAAGCLRPYTADSPWNTKLVNPTYHPQSDLLISTLNGKTLTSDPTQYTYPVYFVDSTTPIQQVKLSGFYTKAENGGTTISHTLDPDGTVHIPIPDNAQPSPGTDSQIILVNESTGDQWGLISAVKGTTGWTAKNGSYYNNNNWSGVAPVGYGARGGGIPYYAGLIRKCEITQGHIDHAIAFGYDYPCSQTVCAAQGFPYFVRPAAKSDGQGTNPHDFPEGTRLQLVATDAEITTMCASNTTCVIIAKALRDYGMITLDNTGHPKIYAESFLTANTVSPIPFSKFNVINF